MNILQALADNPVVSGRMSGIEERLAPYLVEDLPGEEGPEILFVLEAPYKAEVECGYPLAGASGSAVSRFLSRALFGGALPAQPFGALLARGEKRLAPFGVLNASLLPLQMEAYPHRIREAFRALLQSFATIRGGPEARRRQDQLTAAVEQALIGDLRRRLAGIGTEGVLLVPCGRLARAFLAKADFRDILDGVPHPAQGQWDRGGAGLDRMLARIRRQLEKRAEG